MASLGFQPSSQPSSQGGGAYGAIPQLPSYTQDTSNQLGEDPWAQALAKAPGLSNTLAGIVGNINSESAGVVPTQDVASLTQMMAERGAATGLSPNAPNTNAALFKALGLNATQQNQLAASQFNSLLGALPVQKQQTGTQGTDLRAQQAIYNAAPNPTLANQAAMGAIGAGMGAGRGMGGGGGVSPLAPTSALGSMGYQSPYAYNAPATTMAAPATYAAPAPYAGGQLAGPDQGYGIEDTNYTDQSGTANYGIPNYWNQ
jgi:hypothetical protein